MRNFLVPFAIACRIFKTNPRVLAFRTWQYSSLKWLRLTRFWERLEVRVGKFWNKEQTTVWLQSSCNDKLLIGKKQINAFIDWSEDHPELVSIISSKAEDIVQGIFFIFDQPFEFDLNRIPWHSDWRFSYTWDPTKYENYHFRETEKKLPYDVKFPWELSRFAFLLPLAQMAALTGDTRWQQLISRLTIDWETKNPLSKSVNWQPMICAIHGINLCLTVLMLAAIETTSLDFLTPLLRQLTLQGEFIFRNLEYSNARGNHYVSNLAGLLLIGATIQDVYKPASRWVRYAEKRICPEIELQYLDDGVHFEKSTSYHRLVTEFFLLCFLVMKKEGYQITAKANKKILQACHYIRCYTRPDGLSTNWGDNDGAWLLAFDPRYQRDHRSLLALAAVYFEEAAFKTAAESPSATIPLLMGKAGVQQWNRLRGNTENKGQNSAYFNLGGMVVSRLNGNFFMADFGEVGKRGLGGHGHNDTFSFELSLCGQPLIIDAGSPIYTGDIDLLARFSSTGYHNTLMVDDQEIAQQLGLWRISGEATPIDVEYCSDQNVDFIQGEHRGYTRLPDPVIHKRKFSFYKLQGRLVCDDMLFCNGKHDIKLFLHFSPNIKIKLHQDKAAIILKKNVDEVIVVNITWSKGAQTSLVNTQVSETFNHLVDSSKLILAYEIFGNTTLFFEIAIVK
jgi:uncharacterized heparinase superfamily protein